MTIENDKSGLAKDIYKASHLVGTFVLRSGQVSNEYFDKYLFEADPKLLNRVAVEMARLLPEDLDMLGGLELGGIPLATLVGQETGRPVLFVRKKAKEYGTLKLAEGGDIQGKKIVLIEDIITSGGAVIDATKALRERGAHVNHVVCAIDRQQGGMEALEELEVNMKSVFTRKDFE